ncbi:hypothetical protein BKA70DRAFT_1221605 [Coprinopsis sp. MPI-PUGE-AT-0042]|nr:hypothetical protein BKA70DRAFT_1221605 [Coprinopsis sp. MPI-PUGE-AT-0042]
MSKTGDTQKGLRSADSIISSLLFPPRSRKQHLTDAGPRTAQDDQRGLDQELLVTASHQQFSSSQQIVNMPSPSVLSEVQEHLASCVTKSSSPGKTFTDLKGKDAEAQMPKIISDVAEPQDGPLLLTDVGVIDVEIRKPLPNVFVDIWQANATGYYTLHPVPRPHLVNKEPQISGKRSRLLSAFPRTIDEETWLRGAWQ